MSKRYDGEWVLSAIVDDRAEQLGDDVFVTSHDGDVTFGGLRDLSQRVAGALQDLGLEPGDRVATMLPSTVDYLAAWFGILWAGGVDVPVNNDYRGLFLEHVLRESGSSVAVIHSQWIGRLGDLDVPELRHIVVVGGKPAGPGGLTYHAFTDVLAHDPVGRVPRSERDLAYIMYTSGTTGPSKGVMHGNRSALWNSRAWIDILSLGEDDIAYSMFPLFHVTARSSIMGSSLWAGARVVLRDGFTLSGFWDDVRESGATYFAYMGAIIHLLHGREPRADDADNSVRIAFGAAAPPGIVADFERRFGFPLIEVYGSTELGVAAAPVEGKPKRATMGLPCSHLLIEVHDADDHVVAPGVEGEIVARPAVNEGMFHGYWQNPEATLESWRNLWFHTGDGGFVDDGGYLVFTDRIKDSIRRRGENISSFEVERAVQAHPDVLECGAYAVPAEITEDEVMVAVVTRPGRDVTAEALFFHCIETMPRFAVPRYIRFLEELPKTPSQRIQKYLLREDGVTTDAHDREAMGIRVPR